MIQWSNKYECVYEQSRLCVRLFVSFVMDKGGCYDINSICYSRLISCLKVMDISELCSY